MANYTTTITNEGAALLASVIANQGTLTFNEFRFSENDYTGQESTLTEGTFLGVFITASAAASVIDSTTIKTSAQFNNSTITGNHDLYSIGIIGTDGNTTALIAVCTTTDPDVIREPLTGTSTYAFNVNLSVSDTSQINVFGTTAAILYDIDVVDTLISTATNKPLSANQGRLIADNLAADEKNGAKNLAILDLGAIMPINTGGTWSGNVYSHRSVDFTVTDNGVSVSGTASGGAAFIDIPLSTLTNGEKYIANGISGGADETYQIKFMNSSLVVQSVSDLYDGERTFEKNSTNQNVEIYRIRVASGANVTTNIYPMIRDARILDGTFVPYAKTNRELTEKIVGMDAITDVYGAKQMLPYPFYDTTKTDNGITFTDNGNGTLTINGTASADAVFVLYVAGSDYASRFAGKTILANILGGNAKTYFMGQADNQNFFYTNDEAQATFPLSYNSYLGVYIIVENGAVITTPITISFMIRDARITDPTVAPYAKTNLQLTNDKAERTDLATLNLTGSTNTTGSTILQDTYFYLNNNYCKALASISNGATFTLNTNYKFANVGEELEEVNSRINNAKLDSTWTTISADYTFPADGYLQLYALPSESVSVTLYDSTGTSSMEVIASGTATGYTVNPIYVRKGMQVHFNGSTSASSIARFKAFI